MLGESSGARTRRHRLAGDVALEPLSDTDYEFLFNQLLEGIAHGWHEGRILKFFDQLGDRGKTKPWVGWLERFQAKVLASPSPNLILAARLLRLAELAQSFPRLEPISQQAYAIGHRLYARQAPDATIWEYDGPEFESLPVVDSSQDLAPEPETETYTLEQLAEKLKLDPEFARQIAHDLGIDSIDPETIVQILVQQFQESQAASPENTTNGAQNPV